MTKFNEFPSRIFHEFSRRKTDISSKSKNLTNFSEHFDLENHGPAGAVPDDVELVDSDCVEQLADLGDCHVELVRVGLRGGAAVACA